MVSPGLIDLSSNKINPDIKLENIFCMPKPIPTPIAPPSTAKAVRSIPTVLKPNRIAAATNANLNVLDSSARADIVIFLLFLRTLSTSLINAKAIHKNIAIEKNEETISYKDMLVCPSPILV